MGLIAITALSVDATHGAWRDDPAEVVPAALVQQLQLAGHRVVILPAGVHPAHVGPLDALIALRADGEGDQRPAGVATARAREAGIPVVSVELVDGSFRPPIDTLTQALT